MRRLPACPLFLICLLCLTCLPLGASQAQQQALPPHTFLFGSWIGGRFPAPANLPPAICSAQPTVIFTADLVMRSVISQSTYVQRMIATVQGIPNGADFVFAPMPRPSPWPATATASAARTPIRCGWKSAAKT